MDFGFAEGDTDTEDGAFALGVDADGDEDGAVEDLAAVADFFVAGVEGDIGEGAEGALAPGLKFGVELGGAFADLGGADGVAAELLDDGADFAGGYALDIHFGHGGHEGFFAAEAFFEGTGVEVEIATDLGDVELDGADAGVEGFGFKAVGESESVGGAFVGAGLEGGGAFLDHGLVDEEAQAFGEGLGAIGGKKLQNGVQECRVDVVGHVWCFCWWCFCFTPTGNHTGQPSRASRSPHPGPTALGSLRSPSLRRPRMGRFGRAGSIYRKNFTPPGP